MASKLITIQGKVVDYGPEAINQIYGLLNHDTKGFTNKDCESGTWLASKICSGQNVPWAATKAEILCSYLIAEARTWMSIVCNRISPSGNISNIPVLRAQIVAWIYKQCPYYERH
uniref:Putative plant transposon protein domain-containing protein n=1 Tax=Solanum tuberosum TaxID=4113 RepID=M1BV18_SOLTU